MNSFFSLSGTKDAIKSVRPIRHRAVKAYTLPHVFFKKDEKQILVNKTGVKTNIFIIYQTKRRLLVKHFIKSV